MTTPQSPGQWPDPTYQPPSPPSWPTPGGDPVPPPSGPPASPTYPAYQTPPPATYGTVPGYGAQPYVVQRPSNGLALAAMICSLAGIVTGISAPVGAVLGHIALKQVRERGEEGEGYAKTGIIVGWIITGLYALCCVGYFAIFAAAVGTGGFAT